MRLQLSKISVDMDSIRAIQWNVEESGIKRDHRGIETRVHWRRTWLHFKNVSDTLTLNDDDPNYETDVEKLAQAWHSPTADIRVAQ